MKNLIKIEELLMLALAVYLFSALNYSWWWYLGFFLAPDIGMAGYLVNTRVGAFTYNFLHHKAVAIGVYFAGVFTGMAILQFAGLIVFGHSSFDRLLGYGLKFPDSFKNTHLGKT